MSSLFANAVGDVAFEVVAAASLAAVASVAALGAHCTKRQHGPEESPVPARKKRRQKKKNAAAQKHPVIVANGVAVNTEPVIAELKRRAASEKWRHKIIYTFLDDLGRETVNLSIEDVDKAARKVAAALQRDAHVVKGDRVMLCFPPGLDFALAFWGCLYAGVVGIPVYPPYPGTLAKDLPKFNRLVEDSGAAVVLTNTTYHLASKMATVKGYFSTDRTSWPANLKWITTDSLPDSLVAQYDEEDALSLTHNDVAFFQYSSGSTSAPKAVMISHGNLRAQLKTWESIEPSDTMVSWLPSYHDMGLVGFIITPCVTAARCVSMSPISFIKDPALWMRMASKYKATHVCAPNFGYALAARKTSDKQAAGMDLSTLKHTICAAEPIRRESLEAFTSKFRASGFDPTTFNCGYGLAEVTLVCTGQEPPQKPTLLDVNKRLLETQRKVAVVSSKKGKQPPANGVMQLVGCGKAMPTFNVAIVDPDTKKPLEELQVGEVWVQGPSVAIGYWNRPEYTEEMFRAQIAGDKGSKDSYLRTGDMGFLRKGELFVTGRLKDLIIIRGRNVCPQDVEASVEQAHENVRPGCTAAFSIEKGDEEALVVVAEVKNGSSQQTLEEICREIIKTVLSEHQLKCEAIVLLRQKTIPKTTSGKIQRSASKAHFLDSTLVKPLFEYRSKAGTPMSSTPTPAKVAADKAKTNAKTSGELKTSDEILAWLLEHVAQEMQVPTAGDNESSGANTAEIDPNTPWAMFGMDSVAIVGLSSDLGEFLGCIVSPSAFFQYDTPFKLANAPGLASGELAGGEEGDEQGGLTMQSASTVEEIDSSCFEIENFPEVQGLFGQMKEFESAGLRVPFLETLTPEKRRMTNFNTYNYLGNASNPEVAAASKSAIEEYGTTMSSSPIVGQTQVNVDLEKALCNFFNAEASILFVGGWVSNVTTIDALVSKGDLILCDALNHDSCVSGQRLSGATILPFPHNDTKALERMLSKLRTKYRRVLIVIEGVYSMDGDIPDVHEMIRIKKKYKALLFIDEAHSFGTMGATGRGICEHVNADPKDVDVRMGTMSKALGSVGGFILGSQSLIKYLKHCAGGFVFSVGLAPACGSAALKSIQLMTEGPSRTITLQERSKYFYDLCQEHKVPMGENTFRGAPVVVVMIGSTIATAKASEFLALHKINVKPIVYPAVEEGKCRLRFFISALHTPKQLEDSVLSLKTYLRDGFTQAATSPKTTASITNKPATDVAKSTKDDGFKTVKKRKSKKKRNSKTKSASP
ncbi:4-hydroxyphenylalkanoate adenylyltransferase [Phytophthora citrophthora]|uniref:4-hydroxyphenylalkanoate adenylyltransferase n=1 Tax=Phytophthora citrophthora TaxID=4793 RepID=A0AAD9GR46_9STRA|nr:4-hydroxyphenylalkanoate adenylyltransferase [Phytophthora citrophthora]